MSYAKPPAPPTSVKKAGRSRTSTWPLDWPRYSGIPEQTPTFLDFVEQQILHESSRSGVAPEHQADADKPEQQGSVTVSGDMSVIGAGRRSRQPSANETKLLANYYPDWFDVTRFKIKKSVGWKGHSIAGMEVALPSDTFENDDWRQPVRFLREALVFLFHESFHAFARSLGRPISLEWASASRKERREEFY